MSPVTVGWPSIDPAAVGLQTMPSVVRSELLVAAVVESMPGPFQYPAPALKPLLRSPVIVVQVAAVNQQIIVGNIEPAVGGDGEAGEDRDSRGCRRGERRSSVCRR